MLTWNQGVSTFLVFLLWYFLDFKDIYFMCMCGRAWVHVCTPGVCRNLKRPELAQDQQELELQMALGRHMGAGNSPWILCESHNSVSDPNCAEVAPVLSYNDLWTWRNPSLILELHTASHLEFHIREWGVWTTAAPSLDFLCYVIRVTPNSTTFLPHRHTICHALLLLNKEKSW